MPHTTDDLQGLSEDEFRQQVLIPLLKAMGYRQVEHTHRPNELGKDIVFWRETDLGVRENVAIVAKRQRISAKASGDVGTVVTQVRQAFKAPFLDKLDGTEQFVHRVIVAASGSINQDAQQAIRAAIDNDAYERNVVFWDAGEVVERLNHHLPERSIPGELEAVRKKLSTLEHFTIVPEVRPGGVFHRVEPKVDGVRIAKGVFTFPETPEGQAMMDAVDRFFEEGGKVTIPAPFIELFEHHHELAKVFGNEKPAFLQLGPHVPGPPHAVRLEVETQEGPLTYDRLALRSVKSGSRRAELRTSEDDPLRIRIVLEDLGPDKKQVSVSLSFKLGGFIAHRARQACRVWRAIADGATFRLVETESDAALLPPQTMPSTDTPPADLVQYLEDLAVVEERLGWSLSLPEHIAERDLLDARELRQILECGSFVQPFDTYGATFVPREGINILAAFPPGETRWLRITTEAAGYTLLDRTLELGPGHTIFPVVLTEEEHKRIAAQLDEGADALEITFQSASGSEGMRSYYRDYLPEEQREEYDRLRDSLPSSSISSEASTPTL